MADLALLRSFLAVYREQSVTRAAEQLAVSQPTITAHLKTLETTLGRRLFDRRARGVVPRPAAHELAGAVSHHLDALAGVLFDDSVGRSARGGVLYLGGPSEFLGHVMLPSLAPLVERGLRIRAMLDTDEPVIEALREGDLDFAILTEATDDPAFEVESLRREELRMVASPLRAAAIPRLTDDPDGAVQLDDVPVLAFSETLPLLREYWREVFDSQWVGSPAVIANSLPALLALAVENMGVTVLPHHVVAPALERGELVVVHEPERNPYKTLYLGWRAGALAHPIMQRARELMRGA